MRVRSRVVGGAVIVALLTQLSACGSIFFPDRRGQIEGKIDPVVAGLDAVGLLFYIIPGLIAFGIDFATGAIYFPEGQSAQIDPVKLQDTIGTDGKVDNVRLKALIEQETGRSLPLDDPRLLQRTGNLQQLAALGLQPAA